MENKYYLIKQNIPNLKPITNRFYLPVEESHLKEYISYMFGDIQVYLINEIDNNRKDLTSYFKIKNFDIYSHSFEKILKVKLIYFLSGMKYSYINFYTLEKQIKFKHKAYLNVYGFKMNLKSIDYALEDSFFKTDVKQHKTNVNRGEKYEDFVGNKYINVGYDVIYNGKKNIKDGGIDLICKKDNSILLVQCKNWLYSNKYKINQKDLRAFIGDCYIYLLNNNIKEIPSFHFIVSNENLLTNTSKIFLKENKILKYKCVPFDL